MGQQKNAVGCFTLCDRKCYPIFMPCQDMPAECDRYKTPHSVCPLWMVGKEGTKIATLWGRNEV